MEKAIYLHSEHPYNFRHNLENPKVIGFIDYKPSETQDYRVCFEVIYESDGKVDYIPYVELLNNNWSIQ